MARYWYVYNGVEDPFETTSYERLQFASGPTCVDGSHLCAVLARGSADTLIPNTPFSANIHEYIAIALVVGSGPIPSNGKPYVYLKYG